MVWGQREALSKTRRVRAVAQPCILHQYTCQVMEDRGWRMKAAVRWGQGKGAGSQGDRMQTARPGLQA